jgi:hypothetical protein
MTAGMAPQSRRRIPVAAEVRLGLLCGAVAFAALNLSGCTPSQPDVHADAQAKADAAKAEAAKAPPPHTAAEDRRAADPTAGAPHR